MIRLEAEPLPDGLPGHARIVVTGTALPAVGVTYQLRREGYASGFLGRAGWQTTEESLAPLDVVAVEDVDGWALVMGPEVSRHMVEAPYQFRLPHLDQEFGIFWPYIEEFVPGTLYVPKGTGPTRSTGSTGTGNGGTTDPPGGNGTNTGNDPQTGTTTGSTLPPPPKPPVWKKPAFVVGVLVLLLAGGGVAVFRDALFGDRAERVDRAPPAPDPLPQQVSPAITPPPNPSPRQAWPAGTDGMTPTEVAAAAPDAAGILLVAQQRQRQGRYDDAIRLLETAAERNEAEAWFILARLYDPVDFVPGRPFQEPSGYEAARHYREALRRGHAAAEAPRAALQAFLRQRAEAGDRDARDALAEFWP